MKKLLFSLLFFFVVLHSQAQRYNFREYSVPDGLIHSTVTSIAEDPRGYLWLGTFDGGVSQFDGNTFVNYSEGEIFAGHYIQDIKIDNKGTIWVASNAGLSNFDGKSFTSYADSVGLLSTRVRALLFDSKDNFWIGTSKGINLIKNDSIYEFEHNDVFEHPSVRSMIEAKDGTIYLGTWKGLYMYKDGAMDSVKTFGLDSIGVVYNLKEDSKGNIWMGTHYGIGKYDGNSVVRYQMDGVNVGQNIIEAIEEDAQGNIWSVSRGGGAFVYDGEEFINITDQNGLSSNGLFSIFKDSNNIMWIGGGGLNKYYGDGFYHLSTVEGLVHNVVFPIIEDKNGNIWLGTEGGLSHLNSTTGEISNYTTVDGLTNNVITSILESKSGDIWVTTQSGLHKMVNGKFVEHSKYKNMELWSIAEDDNGDVWIGSSFGLIRERQLNETLYQKFTSTSIISSEKEGPEIPDFIKNSYSSEYFTEINGFADEPAYTTTIDDFGNIWVGTPREGVFKYNGSKFENFNINNGLNSNDIIKMKSDGNGGVWIGTGNGLSHYSEGEIRNYTKEDGLWMDMIYNIIVDNDENIWIGGTKGIQKLTFDESGELINESKFGQQEGFTSIETNDGGGMKDSNGNLWFGTIGGATVVDPENIAFETPLTTTHITDIKLFFEDIDWSFYTDSLTNWYRLPKTLLLPHDRNQLTFEFVGLNLKVPEKIQYQWKLDGFDNNWSPITLKREANYTNIPPGDYTFFVKATNERGAWNTASASFSFSIDYPIYQRWWFITLCIAFSITAIWGFIGYRLKHIRKIAVAQQLMLETERKMVESERKALRAQINPHFIFNVLNSIQYYIQDNEPLVASRYLSKFAKLMRMILDNSKYSSVPIADELSALRLYIDLEILRSEYKFDYDIQIEESIDVNDGNIPPMLMQPFIENSIRHGIMPNDKKGVLLIKLTQENNTIRCVIEDNGVGINKSVKNNRGNSDHISSGMEITGDRLDIINSQRNNKVSVEIVDISDVEPDKTGTRVTIYIPVEQS